MVFLLNHACFSYIHVTTLNNKETFGSPYNNVLNENLQPQQNPGAVNARELCSKNDRFEQEPLEVFVRNSAKSSHVRNVENAVTITKW